jgi:hypothetical protein
MRNILRICNLEKRIWLVSRHPGAQAWLVSQGVPVLHLVQHR